ncbi:substrate-binding and VWA domain-containing protein [Thermobifida cellulosilytica]|uniref:von Willebrand factor A n=1 Tax=Thermobifida cellulosilytica TB100 TaxID=665004 RepID=A0A147KEP1_THECS|nr:substrate-binding and VWA domain-containing protein [Thermobifida cellulosilytica]KUP95728.1 von Willebrand factor A [Thermobifida cellulosilytica TB100]
MVYQAPPAPPKPRRRLLPFLIVAVVAVLVIALVRWVATGANLPSLALFGCSDDAVTLTVASSPEKAGVMRQLAEDYSGTRIDEGCVEVSVVEQSSGATLEALQSGEWDEEQYGPRPDVWSPASSGWVQIARQRTAEQDRASLIPDQTPSIANSPLVIAMPRPMAEALGWPDEKLGWQDLHALADAPEGWGSVGHPEWGDFRMGKTNPNYSTSGLNATIGTYFAGTGLASDLTVEDIDSSKTRAFVSAVERSIVHYGDITMTFLSNLRRADAEGQGLTYISAVAVEEMSVVHYNQGNPTGDPASAESAEPPNVPLVAVYPEEGTLMSDHPYVVLDWTDEPRRAAAAGFLDYLRGDAAQQRFLDNAFRGHDGAVGELLNEGNGVLPDAPPELPLPSAPVLDAMLANWAELRKPANVLLVIDTSGSMEEPVAGTGATRLELAKEAASASIDEFSDSDRVGLWMFSTDLEDDGQDWRELVPIGPLGEPVDGRPRREELAERIANLPPGGGTGLHDTVLAAHSLVAENSRPDAINAVVFLTDGRNEDLNGIGLEELLDRITPEPGQQGVRVFTISYGEDADLETMTKIAEATDAAAYDSSDPESIGEVFEAVISNF